VLIRTFLLKLNSLYYQVIEMMSFYILGSKVALLALQQVDSNNQGAQ
jgi:hypothetical protein